MSLTATAYRFREDDADDWGDMDVSMLTATPTAHGQGGSLEGPGRGSRGSATPRGMAALSTNQLRAQMKAALKHNSVRMTGGEHGLWVTRACLCWAECGFGWRP